MRCYTYILVYFFAVTSSIAINPAEIKSQREILLRREALLVLGGNTTLTPEEEKVDNCLMKYKFKELDDAFDNPDYFNYSHHFFTYKQKIPDSKVYQIIKDMPKGSALHIHDMGILGPDYLMNVTYRPKLYICQENKHTVHFKFANSIKTIPDNYPCKWERLSDVRTQSKNVTKFDAMLRKHFTLVVNDPDKEYPTITESWDIFMNYFVTVVPLLTYVPVWEQYFYDTLKEFKAHNIMYVEVRSILPVLYDLDGSTYSQLVTAKSYKKAVTRFKKDNPDFFGAKLIFAPPRKVGREVVAEYIELAKQIKADMPETFAGLDLVGQEDLGAPLLDFVDELSAAAGELNYFFHAGETNWYGTSTDANIVDAILLGAKRIGHGFALDKHPLLLEEVRKRNIGIEVNIISNTVLSLVRDLRNHPLSVFLALGLPVIISSDDPGVWEADPISSDYYIAFVAAASKLSDLRLLKALILNSVIHSSLDPHEKDRALEIFHLQWNKFIVKFECDLYK